jgi:hypothetical protein
MKGFGCVLGGKEVNMRTFRIFLVFFVIISGLFFVSCGKEEEKQEIRYHDLKADVKCSDAAMEIYNIDDASVLKNIYVKLLPCGHEVKIEKELEPFHKMTLYLHEFTKDNGERYNATMYKYDKIEIRADSVYIVSGFSIKVKGIYERLGDEPEAIITPIK